MKLTNISILFYSILFLTMLSSCSKETTTEQFTFQKKEFIVTDANEATTIVQTFLAAVSTNSAVNSRTTYPDTDISEGRWILEASGNYEKNANYVNAPGSGIRTYALTVDNVSISGNTLLSGTDLITKFASMLATAEANRQGTELVAGFDVKIDYVTAQETKFIVHTVFVLPPPPPPYDCTNASSLPPNPTVETNINYVHTEALACLNANIRANNASTILAMNICSGYDINDETTYWAPDLLFVSAAGDLPWADIVVGEGGRKCSSLGECLPDRPLQYPGISLVITAKQFVEDQVRIAEDIANDIENEAFAPTGGGQAVTPDVFMWRVNLDLDPEIPDNPDGTPGTETILFMEIRDVQFARYLIACN